MSTKVYQQTIHASTLASGFDVNNGELKLLMLHFTVLGKGNLPAFFYATGISRTLA
jgi:hypothetical protein